MESNFAEDPSDYDVIMILKQRMHSQEWSQPPFVFAPAARLARLGDTWPKPTVRRAVMNEDMVKEYQKTIAKVIAPPWNLVESANYLKELIKQSGTLPKPTREELLGKTMEMSKAPHGAETFQADADMLKAEMFAPASAARVNVVPAGKSAKPAATKSRAKRPLEAHDSDASVVMMPAEPFSGSAPADSEALPSEPEALLFSQPSLPADELPTDASEAELPSPPPAPDVEAPVLKRPGAKMPNLKRPAAAMKASKTDSDKDDAGANAAPKAKPKAKAKGKGKAEKPKAKAKGKAAPYLPAENESYFKLKLGQGICIPTDIPNLPALGCKKCRESMVGCAQCREANGWKLNDGKIWKYQPS